MKKNLVFIILLTISSLSLAGTAAYFSIFGLSKLFYSAGIGIIILASVLELSKLVAVSYVYRYWKYIAKALRAYYIFGVLFIMLLTSIGIYGFLTSAYQSTANKIEIRDSKISIAENKKALFIAQLDRINKSIESKDKRISVLTDNRNLQEQRLSELYGQNKITSARRTENQITGSEEQSRILYEGISEEMKQANVVNDSISYYDQKILELKSSDVSSEIGPLKYLSDLTGYSMNRVVNILVLLIIFVFDPMAITLLIGVNQLSMMGKRKDDDYNDIDENNDKHENIKEKNNNIIYKIKNIVKNKNISDKEIYNEHDGNVEKLNYYTIDNNEDDFEINCPDGYIEKYNDIDSSNIKIGQIIYHNNFGKGVVKKIDKKDNNRIFVKFEKIGTKELNTEYAKLKSIDYVEKINNSNSYQDENYTDTDSEINYADTDDEINYADTDNEISEIEDINEKKINNQLLNDKPIDNIEEDKNIKIDLNENDIKEEKKNFYQIMKKFLKIRNQ